MVIGSNQRLHSFSDDQINIEIYAKLIIIDKEAKSLGVIIDEHLSWSNHIDALSKKISSAIGALKRIRRFISEHTALQIYQALILPHFDYCSSVWGDCNLTLRTVPTIVIAHTFCASPDTRISYRQCLLIQRYFCAV